MKGCSLLFSHGELSAVHALVQTKKFFGLDYNSTIRCRENKV